MADFLNVLGLAALSAAGVIAGGLTAEVVSATRRVLAFALHAAVGVGVGVIAVELMPEALSGNAPHWTIVIALVLGGTTYMIVEWMIDHGMADDADTAPWKVYLAVATDLTSDGLMIGAGALVSPELGLALGVGQFMANAPEGFATVARFRRGGAGRWRRIGLSLSFAAPCLLAATAGYWLLRDADPAWRLWALAFCAGILVVATVEEVAREADETAVDTRWNAAFVIGGFALFALVAGYIRQAGG